MDSEFPPWRTLIQMGWQLLKPDEEPPRKKARLTQLAAVGVNTAKPELDCFPDSPLVTTSIQAAMEAMWGRDWYPYDVPDTTPPGATLKPQKWVHDFKKRFYVDPEVQSVPASAPKFTAEEMSLLKRGTSASKIPVPLEEVAYIETLSRQALLSLGTVDWLMAIVRQLLMDPHADKAMVEQTWAAILRALRHSTQWVASSVASSTVTRRKAFLAECTDVRVPAHAKSWLQFQPLPQNNEAMFGDCMPQLRKLSQAESQTKLLSWAARSSTGSQNSFRPSQSYYSKNRGQSNSQRGRGASRGQNRGSRRPFYNSTNTSAPRSNSNSNTNK